MQWCIFYPITKDPGPSYVVKIQQKLVFSIFATIKIILSSVCFVCRKTHSHFQGTPPWLLLWVKVWSRILEGSLMVHCTIWYYLYNLKNVAATLLKLTLLHGCFHIFKLYKWYQIAQRITLKLSKILAMMKHYKKIFLMKQFLRKVLSPYFYIFLNKV